MAPALLGRCCFGAGSDTSQAAGGGGTSSSSDNGNIILNHDFTGGLKEHWFLNCCEGYVAATESDYPKRISGLQHSGAGAPFAVITKRNEVWQGLEQEITQRVRPGLTYQVSAWVAVSGSVRGCTVVQALLKLVSASKPDTHYVLIARIFMPESDKWERLEGTFSIPFLADTIKFYFEADPPGLDMLVGSVTMTLINPSPNGGPPAGEISLNPRFEDNLDHWSGRDCLLSRHSSHGEGNGKVLPLVGNFFALASRRSNDSDGIQQEITGRVQRKLAYEVIAIARVLGVPVPHAAATVKVTLWVLEKDLRERHTEIAESHVTDENWVEIRGRFLVNNNPSRVILYVHGPEPATDILLNSFQVRRAVRSPVSAKPQVKSTSFGKNILTNSNLIDGTDGWFPRGNCTLSVGTGAPLLTPPMARISTGVHELLSGRFILAANRLESSAGPAQTITEKLDLYMTYQVSTWVRVAPGNSLPEKCITIKIIVDGVSLDVSDAEADDGEWREIGGSFRIEKQPAVTAVQVGGPPPGVDLMIAGLTIFPVDRTARFEQLKKQTQKIRQREVILKFSGAEHGSTNVKIKQVSNSFPLGSCINRTNIDNEDLAKFFVKNFNWAVFGNELKWSSRINSTVFPYQMKWGTAEAKRGKLYFEFEDADEVMEWCQSHGIEPRGHCIFWEVEEDNFPWIRELNKDDLMKYTQKRLTGLLSHFKGKFKHYDVNNEMLRGSFYKDRLGKVVWSNMFKTANQLDPSASMFVNESHIEDGRGIRSSPERYIQLVTQLQKEGAVVGGIGIKGHISSPVGSIVCSALDKLSMLGLPVWFTELDVSSSNEHVRADDLEVMLREAFAHPAVEGIILWGFWELGMVRGDAHLINAEGEINEAGKRFLSLKKEWLTEATGSVGQDGEFRFRGFHGTYEVEVVSGSKRALKTVVVDKGELPLLLSIKL